MRQRSSSFSQDSLENSQNLGDHNLWNLGFNTIRELETEQGILASGKEEIYGCIFGRDSLITSLKLLKVYETTNDEYFLGLVRKILSNLAALQGTEMNIESGEEPGKCIHEYRPQNHEHLTKNLSQPWFVYPDMAMRNYDSVDSTPLFLIALYNYYDATHDQSFIHEMAPHIQSALGWLSDYGDSNGDTFIDYQLRQERSCGGLVTQSWMDSEESVFLDNGEKAIYPIAPVEVQAYTYLAFKLWAKYFNSFDEDKAHILHSKAHVLKSNFNHSYVRRKDKDFHLISAIDGNGRAMNAVRSSMGHCLWASYDVGQGERDCILNSEYIDLLAERLVAPDLFEPQAGLRTLSANSDHYSPNSYHNGSIWPHDTSIVAEGLESFGYTDKAQQFRQALRIAISHFNTPIELFVYDGDYKEYESPTGQKGCKKQAWCAASILKDMLSVNDNTADISKEIIET